MPNRLIQLTLAFLVLGLALVAKADVESGRVLKERTRAAIARFDQFADVELELISRSEVQFTVLAFDEAVGLVQEVSKSPDLEKKEKVELIVALSTAAGKFFERLTEPYQDPIPPPPSWNELGETGWENKFGRFFKWGWDRFGWYAQMIGKDVLRTIPFTWNNEGFKFHLPYVFPFFGSDGQRSRAAKKMSQTIAQAIDAQMELVLAGTAEPHALAGISMIVEEMRKAEPMKYGARNQLVRYAFLGLAAFCFLHPPINPFPFFWTEKTKWSPMVSAILQSGLMLWGARTRKLDSGLQAYWTLSRALKRIQKDPKKLAQWRSCGGVLADEGTDPLDPDAPQAEIAQAHPDAGETNEGMRRGRRVSGN